MAQAEQVHVLGVCQWQLDRLFDLLYLLLQPTNVGIAFFRCFLQLHDAHHGIRVIPQHAHNRGCLLRPTAMEHTVSTQSAQSKPTTTQLLKNSSANKIIAHHPFHRRSNKQKRLLFRCLLYTIDNITGVHILQKGTEHSSQQQFSMFVWLCNIIMYICSEFSLESIYIKKYSQCACLQCTSL